MGTRRTCGSRSCGRCRSDQRRALSPPGPDSGASPLCYPRALCVPARRDWIEARPRGVRLANWFRGRCAGRGKSPALGARTREAKRMQGPPGAARNQHTARHAMCVGRVTLAAGAVATAKSMRAARRHAYRHPGCLFCSDAHSYYSKGADASSCVTCGGTASRREQPATSTPLPLRSGIPKFIVGCITHHLIVPFLPINAGVKRGGEGGGEEYTPLPNTSLGKPSLSPSCQ